MWIDKKTEKRVCRLNGCTPAFLVEVANVVKIPSLVHDGGRIGHAGREAPLVHACGVVDGYALEHVGLDLRRHVAALAQAVEEGLVHYHELAVVGHEDELAAAGELV